MSNIAATHTLAVATGSAKDLSTFPPSMVDMGIFLSGAAQRDPYRLSWFSDDRAAV
jgi:hypothetical protein